MLFPTKNLILRAFFVKVVLQHITCLCPDGLVAFLWLLQQGMVALYVSSHYKNTPNDLLLMSDAPAHHLFVLLGPVDETKVRDFGS